MPCCFGTTRRVIDPESFAPDLHSQPLTEKFYARHEYLDAVSNEGPVAMRVKEFERQLDKLAAFDIKDYAYSPTTTNQTYGWFNDYIIGPLDDKDCLMFCHHKRVDSDMRVLYRIAKVMHERRMVGISR